ncbi:MAG: metallophosphoesterase [Pirellulaceae bacterium]
MNHHTELGRRAFLKDGLLSLSVAGLSISLTKTSRSSESKAIKLGMVTDLHFADKPTAGSRHYRETPSKLAVAVEQFKKEKVLAVVELGDLIDAADTPAKELAYLKTINEIFSKISPNRHYVLGNHCVYTLTKQEFLTGVEQKRSYYSFDLRQRHFVILDSCFRSDLQPYGRNNFEWTDTNMPPEELKWLRRDLGETKFPTVVFAHQRLDVKNHYGVKNADAIRTILAESGKVAAVFQGHSHKNDYHEIDGIHYCTLVAMVEGTGAENNGFSILDWTNPDSIQINGFRRQADYQWKG